MKHNKKRNTAFLYECLIRELTKAIVQENKSKQTIVKGLLKEFFSKGKALKQELDIYRSLLESKELEATSLVVGFQKTYWDYLKKNIYECNEKCSPIRNSWQP